MAKYKKKPIVVEAFQMTEETREDNSDWPEWLNRAWNGKRDQPGTLQIPFMHHGRKLEIFTLEGPQQISWNDWIIQGVKGELYPCKPDVFEATYECVG